MTARTLPASALQLRTTSILALAAAFVVPLSAAAQSAPADPAAQSVPTATSQSTASPPAATPAETIGTEPTASPSSSGSADVVVTGSRIRGVAPVGSSVISIGQDALTKTTAITTQDLINQVPQNVGAGINEATNVNPFGTSNVTRAGSINLRGLGPQATLLLLDGHRLTPSGPSGNYLDPSSIPAIALQRIEVVADGSSAIYGADAVAGVVNLILRRDVDGLEANARYGFADGYHQFEAGAVAGTHWNTGRIMLAYEYTFSSRLAGTDRNFFVSDLRPQGGTDFRSTQCNPGTVQIGTTTYPIPTGAVTPATLVAGAANRCETTRNADILPQQRQHSITGSLTQKLTDWLSFYTEGQASWRQFNASFVTQGSSSLNTSFTIRNTNPYFVAPAGSTATSETILYSFLPDFGPLVIAGHENTYNVAAGFNVDLPGRWKASLGGTLGRSTSLASNLTINSTALNAALASTSTATAFNPYGPGLNSPALVNSILSGLFEPVGTNKFRDLEVRADGPVFTLPGGDVRAAIGGESNHTTYFGGSIRGTVSAPAPGYSSAARTVTSAYGEIYVPVFGSANARAGLQTLALSAAVRYDHYDSFGGTTNPKFGVTWAPVNWLELHGSYGTSFRAPALTDTILLKPGAVVSGNTRADPLAGNTLVPVVLLNFGNPNLKPETATTWSVGARLKPEYTGGFSLAANYFNITYQGEISSVLNDPTVLQRASIFSSLIRRFDPALTTAQILADPAVAALIAQGGVPQNLPATSNYIIDARPQNLGVTKTSGLDLDGSYRFAAGRSQFVAGAVATYFFNYEVAQTTAAPLLSQLNNLNYPLRFKARGSLSWTLLPFDATVFINYANSYNNPSSTVHPQVSSYTTFDLHAGVDLGKLVARTSLSIDVSNLFDRRPPFVDIDNGYDPGQASALGRLVSLTLRVKI